MIPVRPLVIVFSYLSLTGCALFVPGVNDLQLVRVQSIEVSALDLHDRPPSFRPKLPSNYVIGKIEVSTKSDIRKIGHRSGLNIWHELTICKTDGQVFDWPGLYYKGVDINPNSTTEDLQSLYQARAATHQPSEPYVYEVYFDPRSIRSHAKGIGHPWLEEPYDFTVEAAELCLRVGGGNMVGGYFKSNIVRVPSADVAAAIGKTGH